VVSSAAPEVFTEGALFERSLSQIMVKHKFIPQNKIDALLDMVVKYGNSGRAFLCFTS
jgi:hypothetical protein